MQNMRVERWERIVYHGRIDNSEKIQIPAEFGYVVGLKPGTRVEIHLPVNDKNIMVRPRQKGRTYYTQLLDQCWRLPMSDILKNHIGVLSGGDVDIYVSENNRYVIITGHQKKKASPLLKHLSLEPPYIMSRIEAAGLLLPNELSGWNQSPIHIHVYDNRGAYLTNGEIPFPNTRLILKSISKPDMDGRLPIPTGLLEYLKLKPHEVVYLYKVPQSNFHMLMLTKKEKHDGSKIQEL